MPAPVDTIRSLYEAFAAGDIPSVLGALAPDVSWTEAEGGPYGGTYTGAEAVLEGVFMKLGGEWDGFTAEPHEFVADGDRVVVLGTYTATYKGTGKSFASPFAHAWKLTAAPDGSDRMLVTTFRQYVDTVLHRRPMD